MPRMLLGVLTTGIVLMLACADVRASSIGLDTPCRVVRGADAAHDQVAFSEELKAGRQWLLLHDAHHIVHTEWQFQTYTLQGIRICDEVFDGTFAAAMAKAYSQYARMVLQLDSERNAQNQAIKKYQDQQEVYHQQVMKNLGQ